MLCSSDVKGERSVLNNCHPIEGVILRLPVLKIRPGVIEGPALRHPLVNYDHAARVRIWKRSQQDRIRDAEDRRVGSDAEGQCQHRGYCESGAPPQLAHSIAQIFENAQR